MSDNPNLKSPLKVYNFTKNSEGKFLMIRHGQTFYNADKAPDHRTNPKYVDERLNETGINQAKSLQPLLNKLSIEKVYVSPLYRALQTSFYALENHPNLENIIVTIHPQVREIVYNVQDMSFDINQCKKDFNMNTKVKYDWTLFDSYVKKKLLFEKNFYYFENINCFPEEIVKDVYDKVVKLYNDGKITDEEKFRKELANISVTREKLKTRPESFKHCFERITEFLNDFKKIHEKTLDNVESKILVFTHGTLINVATSQILFESDEIQNLDLKQTADVKNGEIVSIYP